ncbi:MAG: metallophosphoesterase family protein [Planctomycetota bacterium]|nr:metallophosphoesterase family protein [Planctomycetota bacterium]
MIQVGILSDTHGELVPYLFEYLQGVDHIIHAGDIGSESLITELEAIAPVTAVRGNTDHNLPDRFPLFAEVSIGEVLFCITHIVDSPEQAHPSIQSRLNTEKSNVVVFGHTHIPYMAKHESVLYLNPGAAGPRRYRFPRTACKMLLTEKGPPETIYQDLDSHTPYPFPS